MLNFIDGTRYQPRARAQATGSILTGVPDCETVTG